MRCFSSRVLAVSLLLLSFVSMRAAAQSGTDIPTLAQSTPLNAPAGERPDDQRGKESLTALQIPFIKNESRIDPRVSYYAPTFAGTVYVTRDGKIVYSLQAPDKQAPPGDRNKKRSGWTVTETLVGGTPRPRGDGPTRTHVSYFIGDDPDRWKTGVAAYDSVALGEVWPGVDVRLRAYGRNMEKLFTVRPGARASRIRMRVAGTRSLQMNTAGALVATTGLGEVTFTRPSAYQERAGVRRAIDVAYDVRGDRYGFRLGVHDSTLPVVIDPLLQATYLGGNYTDSTKALTIHPTSGEVYVAGFTASSDFPGTTGGAQAVNRSGVDAFVARLSADLTVLHQATYLGGSDVTFALALAIHPASGEVYVAGSTESRNFPGTTGGAQATPGGGPAGTSDAFVARLNADLTVLEQSTYLGGSDGDFAWALAIHPMSGEIYVAGDTASRNFPGTAGGAESAFGEANRDAFVARLSADLTSLNQSTYLGGHLYRELRAFALSIHPTSGDVYVAGGGGPKAATECEFGLGDFIARLNAGLTMLNHATCLNDHIGGGTIYALAIHPTSGEVYVAGSTSSAGFPGTSGGAQPTYAGGSDAVVARWSADLSTLEQSTYLGGSGREFAYALAIHPVSGEVHVAGSTKSTNFPGTGGGAQGAYGSGASDAFVARLNADLTTLGQATYLGGDGTDYAVALAIHPMSAEVYAAGNTDSSDFPGTAGAAQNVRHGLGDAFIARLTPDLTGPPVTSPVVVNHLVKLSQLVTSFDATPVSGGPAGTYTITATFKNTSSTPIHEPIFKVTQLSGGNLLLNANGGPGGVGSLLTPNVGADAVLSPGESFTTAFGIGLQVRRQITFFVDLLGVLGQ